MPNAHTHLAAVNDLLSDSELLNAASWLHDPAAQAAFLLGSISPDVRVISGQKREATHFFDIPPSNDNAAQDTMLAAHPNLQAAQCISPTQAAFVAGYITHLVMDQTWLEIVVMPGLFITGLDWGTRHPNWRLYGILMTWLEYRAAARLKAGIADSLISAQPDQWLPFIQDRHLAKWRDHVVAMIRTDGARRTSEIFAHSNQISAAELEAIVLDETRMAQEAYPTVAPERLAMFEAETARRSLSAVLKYLGASESRPYDMES